MPSILEVRRDQISCTYYFNDHIYIGKKDGSLIQMNMNGEILYSIKTGHGSISTIFCSGNKLVTCGSFNTLCWDIVYPLKNYTVMPFNYSFSAAFGDMTAYSHPWGPIVMGPIEFISPEHRSTINFRPSMTCLYMNGPVVFAGFRNGEFLKIDYLTGKLVYIYEVENDQILLNDGERVVDVRPGEVRSICIWRDSIIVSSAKLNPGNMATVIRWKCISTDLYAPELFLKFTAASIKIMDDQLFELGDLVINCWSWDKIHLRSIVHYPSPDVSKVDRSGSSNALLINGSIYLVDNNIELWKETGILIEFSV